MNDGLSGLAVLVTGGASGIGLATARMMADRGATVTCLDLEPAAVEPPLIALRGDVSDDSVADLIAAAADRMGGLDVVVNQAGINARGTVETIGMPEWHRVFDVNVFGMVRTVRAALAFLRASARAGRNPSIVNTCSILASVGVPGSVLYSATKGAVHSLTLAMSADYVHEGIRVNCVAPGPVDTPWVHKELAGMPDPAAVLRALEMRQPIRRLVSADEVAAGICYLASPLAGATTGTMLAIDGGLRGMRVPGQREEGTRGPAYSG